MDEKQENMAPGAGPAVAEDEFKNLPLAEHVLKSLTKLIHGRKLYAENNPRLAEFAREFDAALTSYFQAEDMLVLGIDQHTIQWRGQTIYENDKREESIAFLLHRDGVGEITLDREAIGEETRHLVQILTEEYHNRLSSEDVVTRFWNADFQHISYRVLDDYLSVEYEEKDPSDSENTVYNETADHPEMLPSLEDKGRVIIDRSNELESIVGYLRDLLLRTCPSTDEEEQEAHFQNMVGSFFNVNKEEVKQYRKAAEEELHGDSIAAFVETVFIFTLMKDNPTAVRDITGVIERVVDYAIADFNPHTLRRILKLVKDFRNEHTLDENTLRLCNDIEARVTEDSVIQSLGEKLKFWNKDSEEILHYFTVAGAGVIDPLLKVLHNVDGVELHEEICNVLTTVTAGNVADLIDKLDLDKTAVARDAIYMANKAGVAEISPKLQELLFYPDSTVKEGMLDLVSRVEDSSTVDMLLNAMTDENKSIRLKAMEIAVTRNDERILEYFTKLAFGKENPECPVDEQETIFKFLGIVGNDDTVDHLKKFAEKKSLVHFGRNRENKFLAIRALENIKTPASLSLLKKLAEDSNELVKTRARRSYNTLAKTMKKENGTGSTGEEVR